MFIFVGWLVFWFVSSFVCSFHSLSVYFCFSISVDVVFVEFVLCVCLILCLFVSLKMFWREFCLVVCIFVLLICLFCFVADVFGVILIQIIMPRKICYVPVSTIHSLLCGWTKVLVGAHVCRDHVSCRVELVTNISFALRYSNILEPASNAKNDGRYTSSTNWMVNFAPGLPRAVRERQRPYKTNAAASSTYDSCLSKHKATLLAKKMIKSTPRKMNVEIMLAVRSYNLEVIEFRQTTWSISIHRQHTASPAVPWSESARVPGQSQDSVLKQAILNQQLLIDRLSSEARAFCHRKNRKWSRSKMTDSVMWATPSSEHWGSEPAQMTQVRPVQALWWRFLAPWCQRKSVHACPCEIESFRH